MKVVIVNRSDSTGGAAVVSRRLMYAMREAGVDARMLVCEKLTDSPYIELAASPRRIRRSFLAERLKIFVANGFDRRNLFKVDTASDGLPIAAHPWVREADAIMLNWVNQGMLSLSGVDELLKLGKPVIWTMHDMWNMTGICHHAGQCERWQKDCGDCPLLGRGARSNDLSRRTWQTKNRIYTRNADGRVMPEQLHFVAVSNWLADLARRSPLMSEVPLSVIPNAFPIPSEVDRPKKDSTFRIVMGAARLDDPVKGLPILVEATRILRERYPEEAAEMELVTFGNIKNPDSIEGIGIRHRHLGLVSGEENIRKIYAGGDAVVSTSLYETLPGTLVEGQVYGCIPVAFGRGGQSDIVEHLQTGYIAPWSDDIREGAARIADGLIWAKQNVGEQIRERMYASAASKFDGPIIARQYVELIGRMVGNTDKS